MKVDIDAAIKVTVIIALFLILSSIIPGVFGAIFITKILICGATISFIISAILIVISL